MTYHVFRHAGMDVKLSLLLFRAVAGSGGSGDLELSLDCS